MKFNSVGVIGAGNIGRGVITDLILHGINATALDLSDRILDDAKNEIINNLRLAQLLNRKSFKIDTEEVLRLIKFTKNLQDLANCDFIIENVPENWVIKKKVYEKIDRLLASEICFGANTSCISITQIGSVTNRPDRIVGMHLMNPVYLKPTVEVIKGFHTSDETIKILKDLFNILNKEAIIVDDMPGFVSNRISHLFMNEAAFVLQDKVATAQKIDAIFKKCFGHKMGPLETADLIGLDTVMHSLDILFESYHDPKYRCCPMLRKLVYAGYLGRKTGKGFYEYPE